LAAERARLAPHALDRRLRPGRAVLEVRARGREGQQPARRPPRLPHV
ncbi:MAG: hypothetical protein AVDCRST_MAG85-1914, partial [uncultured Solirubrobacteraceae bacterium]